MRLMGGSPLPRWLGLIDRDRRAFWNGSRVFPRWSCAVPALTNQASARAAPPAVTARGPPGCLAEPRASVTGHPQPPGAVCLPRFLFPVCPHLSPPQLSSPEGGGPRLSRRPACGLPNWGPSARSWHVAGLPSAPFPGGRARTLSPPREDTPFLVLGLGTLMPLLPSPRCSEAKRLGDSETAAQNTQVTYTHLSPACTPHMHTHAPTPQKISRVVRRLCPTHGPS